MKKYFLIVITNTIILSSCSQDSTFLGPGYRWDLFKNTPNWDLAKAVAKEDTAEIYAIVKSGKAEINLQEPKFGRTLLMLAVGNDKELSTAALLKMEADVKLRDKRDYQAIHEAVAYIDLRKNSLGILKLLLEYGSDVNSVSTKGSNAVPLQGAIENISCTKLLLKNGADTYFKNVDSDYVVWSDLCSDLNDNIYVAEYLIIEKRLPVPNPILYTYPNHEPRNFYDLLSLVNLSNDPKKEKAKEDIINYLHQIDFPKKGVYQKSDTAMKK